MSEKNQEHEPVKTKHTGKTISISGSFYGLIGVVAVVGLLITAFALVTHKTGAHDVSLQQSQTSASLIANRLSSIIAGKQEMVRLIANDPVNAELLATKDFTALEARASHLEKQSMDIIRVRFLPPEHHDRDNDPVIPLTFSSLDLAHRAEKSIEMPAAEIHSPNTDKQHLALAAAVRQPGGKLVGVMHVAFSSSLISNLINSIRPETANVLLQQSSGKKMLEIARSPGFSADSGDNQSLDIKNTIWTLVYQPVASGLGGLNVVIAILVGVLIAAVMAFLKMMQLKKAMQVDMESIVRIVDNKVSGKNTAQLGNYALKESQETIKYLAQLNFSAAEKTPAKRVPEKDVSELQKKADAEEQENKPVFPSKVSQQSESHASLDDIDSSDIAAEIFREYDIRGVVGDTLNLEHAYVIGKAIGSMAIDKGETSMLIARDGRVSSKDLASTLVRGLMESGISVIDLGMVPTPVMYFGTHFLSAASGVMVTGSHNPASYNGFKVVINGETLKGDEIQLLYQRILSGSFVHGEGSRDDQDILPDYLEKIGSDVQLLRPMNVVLDCGSGVASVAARMLFEALGCDVTTLYCDVDGKFPHHHPDPGNPENMQDLVKAVKENNADLGIAFDGDGDRIGVVDSSGKIIMPDRILMLLAADVLLRNPGADIIYDVKSTKNLASQVLASGGRPIMWKSGHSLMKAKIRETGALLAGELSGHIFFQERWYGFDDALYAGARLLEVISGDGRESADIFAELPDAINTPELSLAVTEGMQHSIMEKLIQAGSKAFPNAKIVDIDGIRAEYPGAWGLIRASNTTPALVFRFEADSEEAMEKVQEIFRTVIKTVLPNSNIPF